MYLYSSSENNFIVKLRRKSGKILRCTALQPFSVKINLDFRKKKGDVTSIHSIYIRTVNS